MGIGEFAASTPDRTALLDGRGSVTFSAFESRQRRLAGAMRAGRLVPGDRIAILSANRNEYLETTIAALRSGLMPVPLHERLTPPEIAYIAEDSGARWFFTDRAVELSPGIERVVMFGDAYERLLFEAEPISLASHSLSRPMHYTSGTTGQPKGVWVRPTKESEAAAVSEDFRSYWTLAAEDTHLVCSPLSHSAPHRFAMRSLEAGATVALRPHFDPGDTLAAIELFGITTAFAVPTHFERMLALGPRALSRHDLSSMRMLVHAGAPIQRETKHRIIESFPPGSVWEFYGSTEGFATRIPSEEWLRKPGSVGTPRPGAEILILDDAGKEQPRGEVGEVWIRDPRAELFEYWGDPAKTAQAWHSSAFGVGDLGYLDDDGYLFLSGRKTQMIISGGVNVYPQEVEDVLQSHPAVAEAVVFGAPHPEWGEEVRAQVVPAFGQPLDPETLKTWLRERLASFKCPKVIEVVEELERTPTGKIRRPQA